jgi:NAD(P)-dependent dehydrogenase (short-subunit alcohol dehydrogenase family)
MTDPTLPRAVLITGAGQRIGRTIALDLARHGWRVGVHYNRSAADAEAVVAEIERAGGRAVALGADLADEAALGGLVGRAAEALGPLGLLVNNASTFENDGIATATRDSWDLHMQANLRAPFVLAQQFAAQLPGDAEGVIVNMIDQRVWNLTPYFLTYTVSKSGLWTLTRTLAMALAPRIRVNAIGPGPTLPSRHQTAAQFAEQCARMPLRRGTTPEEISETVRFILAARAMTGQMIALDGGQHLGWAHLPVEPELS